MERKNESNPLVRCPVCESSAIRPLQVVEHTACGAVKPESAFRRDDATVCPDCGADCSDDLVVVDRGTLFSCQRCDERFDATSLPTRSRPARQHQRRAPSKAVSSRPLAQAPPLKRVFSIVLLFLVVTSVVVGAVGVPMTQAADRSTGTAAESETTYRSIVIFRNDDIQAYYRQDAMRAVDDVFVEEGVPVTLGVIPVNDGEKLNRGMAVCRYLRQRARNNPDTFEFALHGYRHARVTDFYNGSEFGGVPLSTQRRWIAEGTDVTEDCTGVRPTTFIPPLDSYDENTVSALDEQGYVVVSGGGWFTKSYYDTTGPFVDGGLLHVPNSNAFVGDWSTGEFKTEGQLHSEFDEAYANGSLYVQMIHYTSFTTDERVDELRDLVEYVKSKPDVRFMTVGEFAAGYADGTVRQTEDGWTVYERSSDSTPDGASSLDSVVPLLYELGRAVVTNLEGR